MSASGIIQMQEVCADAKQLLTSMTKLKKIGFICDSEIRSAFENTYNECIQLYSMLDVAISLNNDCIVYIKNSENNSISSHQDEVYYHEQFEQNSYQENNDYNFGVEQVEVEHVEVEQVEVEQVEVEQVEVEQIEVEQIEVEQVEVEQAEIEQVEQAEIEQVEEENIKENNSADIKENNSVSSPVDTLVDWADDLGPEMNLHCGSDLDKLELSKLDLGETSDFENIHNIIPKQISRQVSNNIIYIKIYGKISYKCLTYINNKRIKNSKYKNTRFLHIDNILHTNTHKNKIFLYAEDYMQYIYNGKDIDISHDKTDKKMSWDFYSNVWKIKFDYKGISSEMLKVTEDYFDKRIENFDDVSDLKFLAIVDYGKLYEFQHRFYVADNGYMYDVISDRICIATDNNIVQKWIEG